MSETLFSTAAASVTASVVESCVTYPLEYLKVREQIAIRPLGMAEKFKVPNYTSVFYKGSSALILGSAVKTMVRFRVYNWATKFMTESSSGKPSPIASAGQMAVAGILTGIAESVILVPFESIKTTMIESSALGKGYAEGSLPIPGSKGTEAAVKATPTPRPASSNTGPKKARQIRPQVAIMPQNTLYKVSESQGFLRTAQKMYSDRGVRAFWQGFNPTIFRQIANSSLSFTTYTFLRQIFAPNEETIGLTPLVALTGITGLVQALATQPIDVIKSRMQTTNGIKLYGNSLLCAYRIYSEEGVARLWAGVFPRWLRIWLSGGIMFVVYEQSNRHIQSLMKENPFAWK